MTHSDTELIHLIFRAGALAKRNISLPGAEKDSSAHYSCKGCWHGRILSILSESESITQKSLADRLEIRPQSLSEALLSLEERAFIERKINPCDKRESLVSITPLGKEHARTIEEHKKKHAKEYLSSLSQSEKDELYNILQKLTAANC